MHQQSSLFDLELRESEETRERLDIVTTVLHYSEAELKEFKKLCKNLMPQYFEDLNEANVNDLLLKILRQLNETK